MLSDSKPRRREPLVVVAISEMLPEMPSSAVMLSVIWAVGESSLTPMPPLYMDKTWREMGAQARFWAAAAAVRLGALAKSAHHRRTRLSSFRAEVGSTGKLCNSATYKIEQLKGWIVGADGSGNASLRTCIWSSWWDREAGELGIRQSYKNNCLTDIWS